MSIREDEQKLIVGTVVNLYTIDARSIGGNLYRFVSGLRDAASVTYQGHTYAPVPIKMAGIAWGGEGAVARLTMTISRLDATFIAAVIRKDNLRGAIVSRLRTFESYLDGQPADPNRFWPKEVYLIERLAEQSKAQIIWQLASPIDLDNKQLPGRQVLCDVCAWQYRYWNGSEWDYTFVQCPYTGRQYFDAQDQPVTSASKDKCSRRVSGCKKRYPDQPLPYSGFIGVARLRPLMQAAFLSEGVRKAARHHAEACTPEESCGLVVAGHYLPCDNLAKDKHLHFLIDAKKVLTWLKAKTLEAVIHSHPYPAQPYPATPTCNHSWPWLCPGGLS